MQGAMTWLTGVLLDEVLRLQDEVLQINQGR